MHDLIIGILIIIPFVVVALVICSPFGGEYKNENEQNEEIKYMTSDMDIELDVKTVNFLDTDKYNEFIKDVKSIIERAFEEGYIMGVNASANAESDNILMLKYNTKCREYITMLTNNSSESELSEKLEEINSLRDFCKNELYYDVVNNKKIENEQITI